MQSMVANVSSSYVVLIIIIRGGERVEVDCGVLEGSIGNIGREERLVDSSHMLHFGIRYMVVGL